jgi:hypothetical protein
MDPEAIKRMTLENAYGNAAPLNAGTNTLDCEFEFVLMYHRPVETKHQYGENHGMDLIRDALSQPQTMKCADLNCMEEFKFSLSVISSNGGQYDKWQVGTDASILLQHPDDLRC